MCAFRVLNPHKTVCWHCICLNYSFEAGSGNQAYRSGVGTILSVVSVVVSRIVRGLVVQSGDWSAGRTGIGREDSARIQRVLIRDRYALQSERVVFYPITPDQAIIKVLKALLAGLICRYIMIGRRGSRFFG